MRVIDLGSGETASCFIPDDPRLRSYAATIRAQRDHVLDEEADTLLDEPQVGDKTRPHTLSGFQPIASEATDAGCIYEGTELSAAELARAAEERSNAERFMDDLVRDEAPLTLLPLRGARRGKTCDEDEKRGCFTAHCHSRPFHLVL